MRWDPLDPVVDSGLLLHTGRITPCVAVPVAGNATQCCDPASRVRRHVQGREGRIQVCSRESRTDLKLSEGPKFSDQTLDLFLLLPPWPVLRSLGAFHA